MAGIFQGTLTERNEKYLKQYTYNLFAYPQNYFEERTAKDLEIPETVRKQLIQIQKDFFVSKRNGTNCSYDQREELKLQVFLKECNWERETEQI